MILGIEDMKASVQIDPQLEVKTLHINFHNGKGLYIYSK